MNTTSYIVIVRDSTTGKALHRSEESSPRVILSRVQYFLSRLGRDTRIERRTITEYGFTAHSFTLYL